MEKDNLLYKLVAKAEEVRQKLRGTKLGTLGDSTKGLEKIAQDRAKGIR